MSTDTSERATALHRAPRPRPEVSRIPAYRPGTPPAVVPGLPGFKLSSNENPFGPLPSVLEAARDALETANRYPDATGLPLREALGEYLGVEPDRIETGAGSLDVLNKVLSAFIGCSDDGSRDEVVFAWRSFESYPISVGMAGALTVAVPLLPDGRHDLDAMLAAITDRTRVVIVCSPNNPTGPIVTATELDGFLARVPRDVLVILDEAYVEFIRHPDAVDSIRAQAAHSNLLVVRTFSKAHGLADLRIGYCVGSPDIIRAASRGAVPFGVAGVAQAAGIASLHAIDAVLDRVDRIIGERQRVVAALESRGWRLPDAQGNFIWLELGERSEPFADAARRRALSVRVLGEEGVRVTIGTPEADDRLLALCGDFALARTVSGRN